MGDMRECLRAVCYNKVQSACAMPVSKTVREGMKRERTMKFTGMKMKQTHNYRKRGVGFKKRGSITTTTRASRQGKDRDGGMVSANRSQSGGEEEEVQDKQQRRGKRKWVGRNPTYSTPDS